METEQNSTNFASILPEEIKNVMSESTMESLKEYFENAVEAKVHDRVQLAVESARAIYDKEVDDKLKKLVIMMDESHKAMAVRATKKLMENYKAKLTESFARREKARTKALLENLKRSIDKEHAEMASKTIKSLMERYSGKVAKIREYYTESVKRDSEAFRDQLIESLSNYIDNRIDKLVPYEDVRKAVKNTAATHVLESFKETLEVASAKKAAKKYLKKPIMEAAAKIKKAEEENKVLTESKLALESQLNEQKRQLFLESKLKGLNSDTQAFARRVMADKPIEWITENFDYCLSLHKDQTQKAREALQQHAMNEATDKKKRKGTVNVPRTTLLETQLPNKNASRLDDNTYDARVRGVLDVILGKN